MKYIYVFILIAFLLQSSAYCNDNRYLWKEIVPAYDSIAMQLEEANRDDRLHRNVSSLIEQMYRIAEQEKDNNLLARTRYWDALSQFETDTKRTEELVEEAFLLIDSVDYRYDYARLSLLQGMICVRGNDYSQAYHIFKKQEFYFRSVVDYYNLGYLYVSIGSILRRIGEYDEAQKYYLKADDTFKKGTLDKDKKRNFHNLALVHYHQGDTLKGINMLVDLLADKVSETDTSFRVDLLTSLYYVSQTLEDKERYARQAYEIGKQIEDKTSQTYTLINMGALHIHKNENDSALYYFKEARRTAQENKDVFSSNHTLYGLAEIYSRLNMPDSAYQSLKAYLEYREEIAGHGKSAEINRLEVKAAIDEYEQELMRADETVRRHKRTTQLIVLFILFVALIGFYILWLLRKKEKINKLLKEAENRELSERLQKERIENEQYQLEIGIKNRELASTSLIVAEKNHVLKDLQSRIENIANQGLLPNEQEKKLLARIKNHLKTDDEWVYFKLHFEEVYPEFFTKLREKHPALSENDLRLCAYLRIGMSAKQIAQMLSVLPETINTNRYRIRKKLQFNQEDSLEDYLRSL